MKGVLSRCWHLFYCYITAGTQLAQDVLDILECLQLPCSPVPVTATTTASLSAAQHAHKVLVQQVLLLRGKLPADSATVGHDMREKKDIPQAVNPGAGRGSSSASPRPPCSSSTALSPGRISTGPCRIPRVDSSHNQAFHMLGFLRAHIMRMQAALDSLPGVNAALHTITQQQQEGQYNQASAAPGGLSQQYESACTQPEQECIALGSVAQQDPSLNSYGQQQQGRQGQQSTDRPLSAGSCSRPRSASPERRWRPCSAQVYSSQGAFDASRQEAELARKAAAAPDLSPYLNYPKRRPASGRCNAAAAKALEQLQLVVKSQQEQLQAKASEAWQWHQRLQELQQQLRLTQQQMQEVQQAASYDQQLKAEALQEAAHQAELVTQREQQIRQLQQQCESAGMQVQGLQQQLTSSEVQLQQAHQHQVLLGEQLEHVYAAAQQHQQQGDQGDQPKPCKCQAEELSAALQQQLQQQQELAARQQQQLEQQSETIAQLQQEKSRQHTDLPLTRSQLSRAIRAQASTLATITNEQLLSNDGELLQELVQVCNSIAAILAVMKQVGVPDETLHTPA